MSDSLSRLSRNMCKLLPFTFLLLIPVILATLGVGCGSLSKKYATSASLPAVSSFEFPRKIEHVSAPAFFKGRYYAAVKVHEDGIMLSSSDDGMEWQDPSNFIKTSHYLTLPNLQEYKGRLYAVILTPDGFAIHSSVNGFDWSVKKTVAYDIPINANIPVNLAVHKDQMFMSFVGQDRQVYLGSTENGSKWTFSGEAVFTGLKTSSEVPLLSFDGSLQLFCRGTTGEIYTSRTDSEGRWPLWPNWILRESNLPVGKAARATVIADNRLLMVYVDTERRIRTALSSDGRDWPDAAEALRGAGVSDTNPMLLPTGSGPIVGITDVNHDLQIKLARLKMIEGSTTSIELISAQKNWEDPYPFMFSVLDIDDEPTESQTLYRTDSDRGLIEYAGVFSNQDISGKNVNGYDIELPHMHHKFYSTDVDDYFIRDSESDITRYDLYYRELRDAYDRYEIEDPFIDSDRRFRGNVLKDEGLSTEEKIEIIVKSHKGLLRNLDIYSLVEDKMREFTAEEWDLYFLTEFFGGDDKKADDSMKDPADRLSLQNCDRIFKYGSSWYVGLNSLKHPEGYKQVLEIFTAYEVLKHRLSAVSPELMGTNGDFITLVNIDIEGPQGQATSRVTETHDLFLLSFNYHVYSSRPFPFHVIGTMLHELIHARNHFSTVHVNENLFLHGDESGLYAECVDKRGRIRQSASTDGDEWIDDSAVRKERTQPADVIFPQQALPNTLRWTRFRGQIFCSYVDDRHRLFVASSKNGIDWTITQLFSGWNTWAASDIQVFKDEIYITFSGGDQRFFIARSTDGRSWPDRPEQVYPERNINPYRSMELEVFNGFLWLAFVGSNNRPYLGFSHDGTTWSPHPKPMFDRTEALFDDSTNSVFLIYHTDEVPRDYYTYLGEANTSLNQQLLNTQINIGYPSGGSFLYYLNEAREKGIEVDPSQVLILFNQF